MTILMQLRNICVLDKVSTIGLTVESTVACGRTTKWRAKVYFSGPMVVNTKVIMWTIRKKATERSTGQMAGSMRASGTMASSMALVFTRLRQARRRKAPGRKANVRHGSEQWLPEERQGRDYFVTLA